MDITSEPDYTLETVIDMEFSLPGAIKALTYRPENGDTMDICKWGILISQVATNEDTILFWSQIHGIGLHQRVMKRLVKDGTKVASEQ